jgi:hypothetical protein
VWRAEGTGIARFSRRRPAPCTKLTRALARGQRLDWFESTEIQILVLISAVAFYVFLVHSLTTRNLFLDLRLLRDRNYSLGLTLILLFGMLNFTPVKKTA